MLNIYRYSFDIVLYASWLGSSLPNHQDMWEANSSITCSLWRWRRHASNLGYNNGENHFVAAQRFINQNELGQNYLQEIADWIIAR